MAAPFVSDVMAGVVSTTGVLHVASSTHTKPPYHFWVTSSSLVDNATTYFAEHGFDTVTYTPYTSRGNWTVMYGGEAPLQTEPILPPGDGLTPIKPVRFQAPPPPPRKIPPGEGLSNATPPGRTSSPPPHINTNSDSARTQTPFLGGRHCDINL